MNSDSGTYGLTFAIQANDNTIWAAALEKMWAKTNGYYVNINAGSPVEVYDWLTGAPVV